MEEYSEPLGVTERILIVAPPASGGMAFISSILDKQIKLGMQAIVISESVTSYIPPWLSSNLEAVEMPTSSSDHSLSNLVDRVCSDKTGRLLVVWDAWMIPEDFRNRVLNEYSGPLIMLTMSIDDIEINAFSSWSFLAPRDRDDAYVEQMFGRSVANEVANLNCPIFGSTQKDYIYVQKRNDCFIATTRIVRYCSEFIEFLNDRYATGLPLRTTC